MQALPEQCPICHSQNLVVQRFYCTRCKTSLEGSFETQKSPFAALNNEQLSFLMTFIRCEGRFNRMETELSLSYPTLRNRLLEVMKALGFEPGKDEEPALTAEERRRILDDLDKGKITYPQAERLLQGLELGFKKGE